MTLRSIPPANRQPLRRLSSMRAATATGFTAIGAQSRQPVTSTFRPNIVRPDPQKQGQKEIYYKAIQSLTKQLEELIASAEEPAEAAYWTQQLAKLKGVDI